MFKGVFLPVLDGVLNKEPSEKRQNKILDNPREMTEEHLKLMPGEDELEVWGGEGTAIDSFLDDDGTQYVVVIFHMEDERWPHINPPKVNHQSDTKPYIYVYDDESEVIDNEE